MYRNTIWERIPDYDFTCMSKQLAHQERDKSIKWGALIDTYCCKLQLLKNKRSSQSNGLISYIYRELTLQAAEQYQADLIQLRIGHEAQVKNRLCDNLLEEVLHAKQDYENLSQQVLPFLPPNFYQDFNLRTGHVHNGLVVLAISTADKHFISVQVFQIEDKTNYVSFYLTVDSPVESIAVINSEQHSIFHIAYSADTDLFIQEVFMDDEIYDKQIYQINCECRINDIYMLHKDNIIIVNHCQGIVKHIKNRQLKLIHHGETHIVESKYIKNNDQLLLMQQNQIIVIDKITSNPQIKNIPNNTYQSLLGYSVNLNIQIPNAKFTQLIEEADCILFVNDKNSFQFYDIATKSIKASEIPTQVQIAYAQYVPQKLIFCDRNGQTYFIDKLINYIN